MMVLEKDPAAVLDYAFDWNLWLGTDTINTYTVTAESGLVAGTVSHLAGVVTFWLSGGRAGLEYAVTCKIVTVGGRTDERSMLIICKDR